MPLARNLVSLLLCAQLASAAASGKAKPKGKEYKDDESRLASYVINTETADLQPELIPPFMELDPKKLPEELREGYQAKRTELLALQKIAEGRRKAPIRRLGKEDEKAKCSVEQGTDKELKVLDQVGFKRIEEDEEMELMRRTNCSECELQEEFTLKIMELPPKKKGDKPRRVFLLYESDPIWTIIATIRSGQSSSGTNFFGVGGHPKCR